MNELIVLFDPAEEAQFPWPAPEAYAGECEVSAPRATRDSVRRAPAPEPYLGMGLAAMFWFGGSSFLALTALALDTLIQLTR